MSRSQAVWSAVLSVVVLALVLALVGVIPLPRKGAPAPPAPAPQPEPKPPESRPPEPTRPEPPGVRRVELPDGFEAAAGREFFYYRYAGGPVDVWIEVEAGGKTTEVLRLDGRDFAPAPAGDAPGGFIYWAPGAGQSEFVVARRDGAADGPAGTATHIRRLNNTGAAIAERLPPAEKRGPLDASIDEFSSAGGKWSLEGGKPVTLREYWRSDNGVRVYTVRLRCQLAPPKP